MDEKKIILVIGQRGTGKSTIARQLIKDVKRLLIYDTLGRDYFDGVCIDNITTLNETWRKVYDKNFRIIYQPLNPREDFAYVCDLVFKCGDMTFLVEEIDTFVPLDPRSIDSEFLMLVQRGRHQEIELIGITQRPYAIPAILRSQCKDLYTFYQFEQRDIEWLRGIIGNTAEEVPSLKQFEYFHWENGNINKGKTVKDKETLP